MIVYKSTRGSIGGWFLPTGRVRIVTISQVFVFLWITHLGIKSHQCYENKNDQIGSRWNQDSFRHKTTQSIGLPWFHSFQKSLRKVWTFFFLYLFRFQACLWSHFTHLILAFQSPFLSLYVPLLGHIFSQKSTKLKLNDKLYQSQLIAECSRFYSPFWIPFEHKKKVHTEEFLFPSNWTCFISPLSVHFSESVQFRL